jgi:hypothetical protein
MSTTAIEDGARDRGRVMTTSEVARVIELSS